MRTYTVEVVNRKNNKGLLANPFVTANTPKEAVVKALGEIGYIVKTSDMDGASRDSIVACKVCLLGGIKESINYYFVHKMKASSNLKH